MGKKTPLWEVFSWVTGCPGSSGKVHMACQSHHQPVTAGEMPEIPAASSVSCHDGRKDSSTCHLKFSWNLLNFSVFRTERAVFTSQIWTILGNLGNHSYNYNTQVQLHPLNVLQHQGQCLFHLSDMRSCKKQTEKTQILRTWLQKTTGVSNPNVVPCPAGTADSLTVQFEL